MEDVYKEALQFIIDVGFDYDNAKTIEDFKELVDELVSIAKSGLRGETPHMVNPLNSLEKSVEEVNAMLKGELEKPSLDDLWKVFDSIDGCKYCGVNDDIHNPNLGVDTKLIKGDYIVHYGIWGQGVDFSIYDRDSMEELIEFVIPIKYCPICGALLK